MTAINALATDGTVGNRATMTSPRSFRTATGVPYARFEFIYIQTLSPSGGDGYIVDSHKTSNGAPNWAVKFRDSANTIQGLYAATPTGAQSVSAGTWYLLLEENDGSDSVVTISLYTCPAGALVGSFTHTGDSLFDDGSTQTLAYGVGWNGSAYAAEFSGRIASPGALWGTNGTLVTALAAVDWSAVAADPLNTLTALVAVFGSSCFWFGPDNTDVSTNAVTLTVAGTMAWGSGNGPDVPEIDAPVADGPSISFVCNGDGNEAVIFDTLFEDELFAEINGSSFLATQGSGGVFFNNVSTLSGTEVEFTGTIEWSDALIRLIGNVDIGSLMPGLIHVIVQNDDGLAGSRAIEVKTVQADEVGIRGAPDPQTIALGGSFSLDASQIAFRADCQEGGTYAATSLPTGLTCSASGLISGTVSHAAAASYTSEASLTDPLGASASDQFVWTVLTPGDPPDPEEPPPEPGEAQPGVVRSINLKDVSRSIGIA